MEEAGLKEKSLPLELKEEMFEKEREITIGKFTYSDAVHSTLGWCSWRSTPALYCPR